MFKVKFIILSVICSISAFTQEVTNLFTLHNGDNLGINFKNIIHETDSQNIFINGMPYLYAGGGVSIEDFNNDGLQDVFMLGNQEKSKLFLNLGGLKFKDVTKEWGIETGNWCSATFVVDVNGDGYKDLYILKSRNNDIETGGNLLYVNKKGKTFKEESKKFGLDFNGRYMAASFFDYDQDGDQDLYLASYPDISKMGDDLAWDFGQVFEKKYGNDLLLNNFKNKKFKNVSKSAGIQPGNGFGLSVLTSDFNADGLLDIFVGNDFSEPDYLYLNNGDGSFKESFDSFFNYSSFFTMGADIGDLNNDGLPDLITLDMNPPSLEKYKIDYSGFDFSLYEKTNNFFNKQEIRNCLQFQNEDLTYTELAQIDKVAFTDWSWSSLICDFDIDGHKDIFITNGLKKDIINQVFYNSKLDSIAKFEGIDNLTNEYILSKLPVLNIPNYFFKNMENKSFSDVSEIWSKRVPSVSTGAALGDLDNDGDIDIVVNNVDDYPLVYENNAADTAGTIMFTTKDYRFLNTKIEIIDSHGKKIYELKTNKGFISSSQPLVTFNVDQINLDELSIVFHFNNQVLEYNGRLLKDSIYLVEDFYSMDLAEADVSKRVKDRTKVSELIRFSKEYQDFSYFKKNPFELSDESKKQPVFTKIELTDNMKGVFLGSYKNTSNVIFLYDNTSKEFVRHYLNEGVGQVLDLLRIKDEYFILSDLNEINYIHKLIYNGSTFEVETIWQGSKSIVKLGFIEDNDVSIIFGIGDVLKNNSPLVYKSIVFQYEKDLIKIDDKLTLEFNKILDGYLIRDVISDFKRKRLIIGGVYEIPIEISLNKLNVLNKKYMGDKSGYFYNLTYNELEDKILFSNIGENFRFNLKFEDSLEVYMMDFDKNGKIDPIICARINNESYPIYTYREFSSFLTGIRKRVPELQNYYDKSLYQIFDDFNFKKKDVKYLNSIENLVLDLETNTFEMGVPQLATLVSFETYKNNILFIANSNDLNPIYGKSDNSFIIFSDRYDYSKNNILNRVFYKLNPLAVIYFDDSTPIITLTEKGIYEVILEEIE